MSSLSDRLISISVVRICVIRVWIRVVWVRPGAVIIRRIKQTAADQPANDTAKEWSAITEPRTAVAKSKTRPAAVFIRIDRIGIWNLFVSLIWNKRMVLILHENTFLSVPVYEGKERKAQDSCLMSVF